MGFCLFDGDGDDDGGDYGCFYLCSPYFLWFFSIRLLFVCIFMYRNALFSCPLRVIRCVSVSLFAWCDFIWDPAPHIHYYFEYICYVRFFSRSSAVRLRWRLILVFLFRFFVTAFMGCPGVKIYIHQDTRRSLFSRVMVINIFLMENSFICAMVFSPYLAFHAADSSLLSW